MRTGALSGCLAILCCFAPALQSSAAEKSPSVDSTDKKDWWAFQRGQRPELPTAVSASNPIDRFILTTLVDHHLSFSPEADRRTLLRRVTLDLTGLPPTPEAVVAFTEDKSPDAYERVVDRLLSSNRYGERWARHWLDVVHFGETHGYDKDKPRPNAWPYRDYVIQALNQDKNYSRFIEEQLAGDVLFPNDPQAVVATGFIAAGPWDFVGHVELPITKTDGLIARYNDRDDMVMTTMSTFQSLTVHCARCHDHKFDPISQREYYQLQAVFAGVDRADRPFDADATVWQVRRELLAEKKTLLQESNRLASIRAGVSNATTADFDVAITGKRSAVARAQAERASPGNGYHSAIEKEENVEKWVEIDLGKEQPITEIRLLAARPVDFPDTPGFGFPRRFTVQGHGENSPTAVIGDYTNSDFPNPKSEPVSLSVAAQPLRFIRIVANKLWKRSEDYVFALAEIEVFAGTNNVARDATVTALDSIEAGRWSKKFLVDGFDSRALLASSETGRSEAEKLKTLEWELQRLREQRVDAVDAVLSTAHLKQEKTAANRLIEIGHALKAMPEPGQVYAAASDFPPNGSFHPATRPRAVHLLARGDVKRPGEMLSAGSLGCVEGPEATFPADDVENEGQRRAALARWITHPKNFLTRRSIVNRVWHYHFGRGLVDTPNDFGHMGSTPTHPELLDWLAYWFLEHDESLKQLHRLMVTSATYRQSSADRVAATKVDSGNRWLWRMNRQRLDAEQFHDTLLLISGKLDPAIGGPSVREFQFKDDHSPVYDYAGFNPSEFGLERRSVYRFIVRSIPDPLLEAYDCPDAATLTPTRSTTITALQALANLNDAFVLRQSAHLARHLRAKGDLAQQIDWGYRMVLLRSPRADEVDRLMPYTKQFGLENFCRLLFNLSEFQFID